MIKSVKKSQWHMKWVGLTIKVWCVYPGLLLSSSTAAEDGSPAELRTAAEAVTVKARFFIL
jgi:hypothetical protein